MYGRYQAHGYYIAFYKPAPACRVCCIRRHTRCRVFLLWYPVRTVACDRIAEGSMVSLLLLSVFVVGYAMVIDRLTRGTPRLIRVLSVGHVYLLAAYIGASHQW